MKAYLVLNLNSEKKIARCAHAVQELSKTFELFACKEQQEILKDTPLKVGEVTPDTDVIISIGGDGTLLKAAQFAYFNDLPLLGINAGHRGALCSFPYDGDYSSFSLEDFKISYRYGLLFGKNDPRFALNDVVVLGIARARSIRLHANFGEKSIRFQGDGLIVATPTGSSAYSASCGGPLLEKESKALVVTPIAPIDGLLKPYVLGDQTVTIAPHKETKIDCIVCYDGKEYGALQEPVEIALAPKPLRLLTKKD